VKPHKHLIKSPGQIVPGMLIIEKGNASLNWLVLKKITDQKYWILELNSNFAFLHTFYNVDLIEFYG